MTKFIYLISSLALMTAGCTNDPSSESPPNRAALADELQRLETTLREAPNSGAASLDTATANSLIDKSLTFVEQFPADTLSPMLLFKAAEVSRGTGRYYRAVELWGKMRKEYPDHPRAPQALFLQGFTFDTHLQNLKAAAGYYREFLESYPESPMATEVETLLKIAQEGKTPDELIQEFREAGQ